VTVTPCPGFPFSNQLLCARHRLFQTCKAFLIPVRVLADGKWCFYRVYSRIDLELVPLAHCFSNARRSEQDSSFQS